MASYRYWVGIFSCFLLFSLVFLGQKIGAVNGAEPEHHGGETGLLLFVIPGFIASYLSSKNAFCAHYLARCMRYHRHFWLTPGYSLWQELAYAVSAVFWCVFGAMLYLFIRMVLHALQHLYQRQRQ